MPKRITDDAISTQRMLLAVPTPNRAVEVKRGERSVVLSVPIKPRWWMGPPLSWVLPYRDRRRVQLDSLGAQVWDLCDGRTTLERIIDRFADLHRLRFHEARLSVMAFIRMLVERNMVVLVFTDDPDPESQE